LECHSLNHSENTLRLFRKDQTVKKSQKNCDQELEDRVAARTSDLIQANVAMAIKEEETRSVVEHMVVLLPSTRKV